MAELLDTDPNPEYSGLTLWLSDQLNELVKDEDNAEGALNLVIKNLRNL